MRLKIVIHNINLKKKEINIILTTIENLHEYLQRTTFRSLYE